MRTPGGPPPSVTSLFATPGQGIRKTGAGPSAKFCDTNFVGTDGPNGGKFNGSESLAAAVKAQWPEGVPGVPLVVCTGGEPLLQLDEATIESFHSGGFEVAVETNGTQLPPQGLDWICVSPKIGANLVLTSGHAGRHQILPEASTGAAQPANS